MPTLVFRLSASSPELQAGLDRVRADFKIPEQFPKPVIDAAVAAAGNEAAIKGSERLDVRDLPFVTIDPPGSRDLDQAYFAERNGAGIRVRYAIADVASFVSAGDVLDGEARDRGVTRYLPDRRAPLYPEVIGEGAASLLPGVDRPALLWTIELDERGASASSRLERAVVKSRRALTYAEAQAAIDQGAADTSLALLRDIGRLRQDQEQRRGGVSVAVPAQKITPERGGYRLDYDAPLAVEGWNAQVSLLAGMCAASLMIEGGVGLLRTLPPPDPGAVERLQRAARVLGIDWPDGTSYAEVVRSLTPNDAAHAAFLTQAVMVLRGAGYAVIGATPGAPPLHSALAAPYAHVTAPLRRLADRFANEVVASLSAGREPPAWARDALPLLPDLMEAASRRAAGVERAVVDLFESLVLAPHVGEVFHGAVVELRGERATLQLTEPAVIATIEGGALHLGDEVSVRLKAAMPEERKVEFELV